MKPHFGATTTGQEQAHVWAQHFSNEIMHVRETVEPVSPSSYSWASLVAQTAGDMSARGETWVRSLGQEDPLEKEMAAHSWSKPSVFAWRIPWTEEPGRLYSPWGCKE